MNFSWRACMRILVFPSISRFVKPACKVDMTSFLIIVASATRINASPKVVSTISEELPSRISNNKTRRCSMVWLGSIKVDFDEVIRWWNPLDEMCGGRMKERELVEEGTWSWRLNLKSNPAFYLDSFYFNKNPQMIESFNLKTIAFCSFYIPQKRVTTLEISFSLALYRPSNLCLDVGPRVAK